MRWLDMPRLIELLPLQFRILYRQFLLRVVDLEALSMQADIPRFLGQFASILVFFSLTGALGLLFSEAAMASPEGYLTFTWRGEQSLVSGMMLVVGLVVVLSWDSTFPDRRDVMVLSPLPIAPHTILFAKIGASAALLGLAVLALNFATGVAWPLLLGAHHESIWGFFQSFAAYWFTMIAASAFVYCSVLTVQGFTALVLARRHFLRLSAILQIVAFGLVLGAYFLLPSITTPGGMNDPRNRWVLAWSPFLWFFALFNQLNGSIPPNIVWLAWRAWISLTVVVSGAVASLLLCYIHAMKKTAEEPDLVPGSGGQHWALRLGTPLQTAIVLFSLRSLTRSRQHRVIFAFFLAGIVGLTLSGLKGTLSSEALRPLNANFLISTFMMMSLAVAGLRGLVSLPISRTANWVWRVTQLRPSAEYIAATRRTLMFLAVVPVWLISAVLSVSFRPLHQIAAHLAVLAFVGWIFVELSLIGLYKIPFTCSYLPGKVHAQVLLLSFLLLLFVLAMCTAELELPSLDDLHRYVLMMSALGATGLGLWAFNHRRAKSAVLYFEEVAPELITTLGLT